MRGNFSFGGDADMDGSGWGNNDGWGRGGRGWSPWNW
jgi:hypothetical protein